MEGVLIVGAGVSGLAAAEMLAREGLAVTVLEARDRIGGRIDTACSRIGNLPIELGAEFVHGAKNQVWEVIREAGLATHELPARHWQLSERGPREDNQAWNELEEVFSKINPRAPDQHFETFLRLRTDLSARAKTLAWEYVAGFHAADPKRVSIHSLAKAEEASETDEGERQFRISRGYAALVEWYRDQLEQRGVEVQTGKVVDSIAWQPGKVELAVRTRSGRERFTATQVLVTVPLGVLQSQGLGGLAFIPRLHDKERAVHALAMGSVVKITLQFRNRFWPVSNFGFIHANGLAFPTWWSDERGNLLTGWVGGPRAESLSSQSWEHIQATATNTLAEIFKVNAREIQDLLIGVCHYDWSQDPFARGAYSYTLVGSAAMIPQLARPVAGTLFFAGEATDGEGEQGTVHGALGSGRRAAREILESQRSRQQQQRVYSAD